MLYGLSAHFFFSCTVYLHKVPGRNRIPIEHRERIVHAFEDYLLEANTLGANRSMARVIASRYIREGRTRERPRGVLVHDEMRERLEDIINENCVVTLTHINGELRRRLSAKPLIHDRAAAQSLEAICFALNWFGPFQQKQT